MPSRKRKPPNPPDLEPGQRRLGRAWQWGAVLVALAVAGWLWRPSSKAPGPSTTGSVCRADGGGSGGDCATSGRRFCPVCRFRIVPGVSCQGDGLLGEVERRLGGTTAQRGPDSAGVRAARKFTHGTQETEVREAGERFEVTTRKARIGWCGRTPWTA